MKKILTTAGGHLCVPLHPMLDRKNGGNLWVMPPRDVWDRCELSAEELTQWSYLISASSQSMLEVLPQLQGGVINYWEAGNWSLNLQSEPSGTPKTGREHKRVHMHLIGRSPNSMDRDWTWGEAPFYPHFKEHHAWWANKQNFTITEQRAIVGRASEILTSKFGVSAEDLEIRC